MKKFISHGIKTVTVASGVIKELVRNTAIDSSIAQFIEDFVGLVGKGKTMADCSPLPLSHKGRLR